MDVIGNLEKDRATSEGQPMVESLATSAPSVKRSTKSVSLTDRLEIAQSVLAELSRAGISVSVAKLPDGRVVIILTGVDYINGKLIAINGN